MSDRLADILASTTLNGIDFVEVASDDQTRLRVHFLNTVAVEGTLARHRAGHDHRRRVGARGPGRPDRRPPTGRSTTTAGRCSHLDDAVPGRLLDLPARDREPGARPLLRDASVQLQGPLPVRPRLRRAVPSLPPGRRAGAGDRLSGKDFASFRQALLDYSAVAYPNWVERSEADLGMMLLELIASVGDDLSYLQDRVAAEATLPTATQRRSVIRHARLVDYEPRAGDLGARDRAARRRRPAHSLSPRAAAAGAHSRRRADLLRARGRDDRPGHRRARHRRRCSSTRAGTGSTPTGPPQLAPYWWDDSERCLPAGATEMWIHGPRPRPGGRRPAARHGRDRAADRHQRPRRRSTRRSARSCT